MKRNRKIAREIEAADGLERIRDLREQLAPVPVNSRQQDRLRALIRGEAAVYRKSLDTGQAIPTHDVKLPPAVGRGTLKRPSTARRTASLKP